MILGEFMDQIVELKEERYNPPVKRLRWQRIAWLLWQNEKTFVLPDVATALGKHPRLTPLEVKELFEYAAIIFGASMYTAIWDEQYIPKVTDYINELEAGKQLFDKQMKYN